MSGVNKKHYIRFFQIDSLKITWKNTNASKTRARYFIVSNVRSLSVGSAINKMIRTANTQVTVKVYLETLKKFHFM